MSNRHASHEQVQMLLIEDAVLKDNSSQLESKAERSVTVFSGERTVHAPPLVLPDALKPNTRIKMDGLEFLAKLPAEAVPVAFLDPQYRGVLEKLSYGNEGKSRGKRRSALEQMSEETIGRFVCGIDRALIPSGHLFLWIDKFHLCQGIHPWLRGTSLGIVDLVTWDKGTFGMGYRTRRQAEYCVVLQKKPHRAKGVWKTHTIRDVIQEKIPQRDHPHTKPIDLQGELMAAVSGALGAGGARLLSIPWPVPSAMDGTSTMAGSLGELHLATGFPSALRAPAKPVASQDCCDEGREMAKQRLHPETAEAL